MFDRSRSGDNRTLVGDDPALQVRTGVAALANEDRDHWTSGALSERLLELMEVKERLDAELLRLVGQWDQDRALGDRWGAVAAGVVGSSCRDR